MPQEANQFKNEFINKRRRKKRTTFIVKPDCLSQGKGIFISRNCDKIIKETSDQEMGYVVQEYLDKPHLVEDLKYDLRLYVMVYGLDPLRIFLHTQGIARFATEPYTAPKNSNMDNMFMHLTNYAIYKENAAFKQNNGKTNFEDEDFEEEEDKTNEYEFMSAIPHLRMGKREGHRQKREQFEELPSSHESAPNSPTLAFDWLSSSRARPSLLTVGLLFLLLALLC